MQAAVLLCTLSDACKTTMEQGCHTCTFRSLNSEKDRSAALASSAALWMIMHE